MERLIEQTLSRPTIQFGLRPEDYLVLVLVATVGSFFIAKLWLILVLVILIAVFRYVNVSKRRFYWSSLYIWLTSNNSNLGLRQSRKLPGLFRD